jgi:hypothetical protein
MDIAGFLKNMAVEAVTAKKAHAFLYYGQDSSASALVCDTAVKSCLCTSRKDNLACNECRSCRNFNVSGDTRVINFDPSEKNVTKEETDQLRNALYIGTGEQLNRICVINNCQALTAKTANAILKILEEPPAGVRFFLTAKNLSAVLPTVISRCIPQHIPEPSNQVVTNFLSAFTDPERAAALSWRFRGLSGTMLDLSEKGADLSSILASFEAFISFGAGDTSFDDVSDVTAQKSSAYRDLINFFARVPEALRQARDYELRATLDSADLFLFSLFSSELAVRTVAFLTNASKARAVYAAPFICSAFEEAASERAWFRFFKNSDASPVCTEDKRLTGFEVSGEKQKIQSMDVKNSKLRLMRIFLNALSQVYRISSFISISDLNFDPQCDKIKNFQSLNQVIGFQGCTGAVDLIEEFQADLNQSINTELFLEALLSRLSGLAGIGSDR